MPMLCCVPECGSDNRKDETGKRADVTFFSFPKDKLLFEKWVKILGVEKTSLSGYSKVCEKHFFKADIISDISSKRKCDRGKKKFLREGAIPKFQILINNQDLFCYSLEPHTKKLRMQQGIPDKPSNSTPAANFVINQKAAEMDLLNHIIDSANFDTQFWKIIKFDDKILLINYSEVDFPKSTTSVVIYHNMRLECYYDDILINKTAPKKRISGSKDLESLLSLLQMQTKLTDGSDATNRKIIINLGLSLLSFIDDDSFKFYDSLKFIMMQLNLMLSNSTEFNPECLIISSMLYQYSPEFYALLKNSNLILLPSYYAIKRISDESASTYLNQDNANNLMHIKQKLKTLTPKDKTVILSLNEIYLTETFDSIVIELSDDEDEEMPTPNKNTEQAKSAYTFTISSLLSSYKDIIHIFYNPIEPASLYYIINSIIICLEEIGFKVICVLTIDNQANRTAMSNFAKPPSDSYVYVHPANPKRPLFYFFDYNHVLKSLRNSWLGLTNFNKTLKFPKFSNEIDTTCIRNAPFTTLNSLYKSDKCDRLSKAALNPNQTEKEDIIYVLQIFNKDVIKCLQNKDGSDDFPYQEDVAEFIEIILRWWNIMNVKTFKNENAQKSGGRPLVLDENDDNIIFLNKFQEWLDAWRNLEETDGKLDDSVYDCMSRTTNGILEILSYCTEELGLNQIFPGKFQSKVLYNDLSL